MFKTNEPCAFTLARGGRSARRVSAALVVVTPSLAHIVSRTAPHRASKPSWLWQSHVHGGSTTSSTPHAKHRRRPYKPPVDRWSQP
jgi:hypothetical protein